MKKSLFVVLAGVLSVAGVCQAQTATGETLMLKLPRASQHALVTQRIGLTASLVLKRSDFDMKQLLEAVGDEVHIVIGVEGVKQ